MCAKLEADEGCFMIDKAFKDELIVYPEDVVIDEDVKACLQKDVMLCFPKATNVENNYTEFKELSQCVEDVGPDDEGWTTFIPRWRRRGEKRGFGESSRDSRLYKDVASSPRLKWTPKADLVHGWRRARKAKESDFQVRTVSLDYGSFVRNDLLFYINFINEWFFPDYVVFDELVDLNPHFESFSYGFRLGKFNFFDAMSILEQN